MTTRPDLGQAFAEEGPFGALKGMLPGVVPEGVDAPRLPGGIGSLLAPLGEGALTAMEMGVHLSSAADLLDTFSALTGKDPRWDDWQMQWWERLWNLLPMTSRGLQLSAIPVFAIGARNRKMIEAVMRGDVTEVRTPRQQYAYTGELGEAELIGGPRYGLGMVEDLTIDRPTPVPGRKEYLHEVYGPPFLGRDLMFSPSHSRRLNALRRQTHSGRVGKLQDDGHFSNAVADEIGQRLVGEDPDRFAATPDETLMGPEVERIEAANDLFYRIEAMYKAGLYGDGWGDFHKQYRQFLEGKLDPSSPEGQAFIETAVKLETTLVAWNPDMLPLPRHGIEAIHQRPEGMTLVGTYHWEPVAVNSSEFISWLPALTPIFFRNLAKSVGFAPDVLRRLSTMENGQAIMEAIAKGPEWYPKLYDYLTTVFRTGGVEDIEQAVTGAAVGTAVGSPRAHWGQNLAVMENIAAGARGDDVFAVIKDPDIPGKFHGMHALSDAEIENMKARNLQNPNQSPEFPDGVYPQASIVFKDEVKGAVQEIIDGGQNPYLPRDHPQHFIDNYRITAKGGVVEHVARIEVTGKAEPTPGLRRAIGNARKGMTPGSSGVILKVDAKDPDLRNAQVWGVRWGAGYMGSLRSPVEWRLDTQTIGKTVDGEDILAHVWLTTDDMTGYFPWAELADGVTDGSKFTVQVGGKEYHLNLSTRTWAKEKIRNFAVAIYDPKNPDTWTQDVHMNTGMLGGSLVKGEKLAEHPSAYRHLQQVGRMFSWASGFQSQALPGGGRAVPSRGQSWAWSVIQALEVLTDRFKKGAAKRVEAGKPEISHYQGLTGLNKGELFDETIAHLVTGEIEPGFRADMLAHASREPGPLDIVPDKVSLPPSGVVYSINMNTGRAHFYAPDTTAQRMALTGMVPIKTARVGTTKDGRKLYPWVPTRMSPVRSITNLETDVVAGGTGGGSIYYRLEDVPGYKTDRTVIKIATKEGRGGRHIMEALARAVKMDDSDALIEGAAPAVPRYTMRLVGDSHDGLSYAHWRIPADRTDAVRFGLLTDGFSPQVVDDTVTVMTGGRIKLVDGDLPPEVREAALAARAHLNQEDAMTWAAEGQLRMLEPERMVEDKVNLLITIERPEALYEIMDALYSPAKKFGLRADGKGRLIDVTHEEVLDLAVYINSPHHIPERMPETGFALMTESLYRDAYSQKVFSTYARQPVTARLQPNQRFVLVHPELAQYIDANPAISGVLRPVPVMGGGWRWGSEAEVAPASSRFLADAYQADYEKPIVGGDVLFDSEKTTHPLAVKVRLEFEDGTTRTIKPRRFGIAMPDPDNPTHVPILAFDEGDIEGFLRTHYPQSRLLMADMTGRGGRNVEGDLSTVYQAQSLLVRLGVPEGQAAQITMSAP